MNKSHDFDLSSGWTLRFPDLDGDRCLDSLADWREIRPGSPYSGSAIYTKTIWLDHRPEGRAILDMGQVGDVAAVRVNGRKTGVVFWPPYQADVASCLEAGQNLLEIEVFNGISCHMDHQWKMSGLLGPVRLLSDETIGPAQIQGGANP